MGWYLEYLSNFVVLVPFGGTSFLFCGSRLGLLQRRVLTSRFTADGSSSKRTFIVDGFFCFAGFFLEKGFKSFDVKVFWLGPVCHCLGPA